MDCEDLLITQAKMIKQASPRTKVMVYRNLVKALPWYPSIAEKLSVSLKKKPKTATVYLWSLSLFSSAQSAAHDAQRIQPIAAGSCTLIPTSSHMCQPTTPPFTTTTSKRLTDPCVTAPATAAVYPVANICGTIATAACASGSSTVT